jgi:protein-S-isoprenylcysteine O-methyltransferase Ste14
MSSFVDRIVEPFKSTPVRTFILYPLLTVAWELFVHAGRLQVEPIFLAVMAWGYLQYRLCGKYRIKRGGGGPGMNTPPERLVTTGPFAYARNPMYLGHIIFLTGLALSLKSWFAAALAVATAVWFHFRVLRDEQRLVKKFGEPYIAYQGNVRRWIPGVF